MGGTFEITEGVGPEIRGNLCTRSSILVIAVFSCLNSLPLIGLCNTASSIPSEAALFFKVLDESLSAIGGRIGVGLAMFLVC